MKGDSFSHRLRWRFFSTGIGRKLPDLAAYLHDRWPDKRLIRWLWRLCLPF